jgi:hypothetical protein
MFSAKWIQKPAAQRPSAHCFGCTTGFLQAPSVATILALQAISQGGVLAMRAEPSFAATIAECVEYYCDEYGVDAPQGFLIFAAVYALGIDEDDAMGGLLDGKNDLGLDFGHIDDSSKTIFLAQGKYTSEVSRDNIRLFVQVSNYLNRPSALRDRGANASLLSFARRYRARVKRGYQTKMVYFHLGSLSPGKQAEYGDCVEYDLARLEKAYKESNRVSFDSSPEKIVIKVNKHFELRTPPDRPRCVVAEIPLIELHRIFVEYRSGLFNENVRLHAGTTAPANAAMRSTLASSEATDFVYYNNGICILCDKIKELAKQPDGVTSLQLIKPQVINGAQTTYTIGQCDEDRLQNASLITRIMSPGKAKHDEFRLKVIRFNNTQTPVKTRDFRANDERLKRLSDAMSAWSPAYFFERKLGMWAALTPQERARFRRGGKGNKPDDFRIVDSQLLGQCRLAWSGRPGAAKNSKGKIFTLINEGGVYDEVFPEECHERASVEEYLLAYELQNMVRQEKRAWAKALRQAKAENDTDQMDALDEDRFVTHFNFFFLAAVSILFSRAGVSQKPLRARLTQQATFQTLYAQIKRLFGPIIRAQQAARKEFTINNWFKKDDNFRDFVVPEIARQAREIFDALQRST